MLKSFFLNKFSDNVAFVHCGRSLSCVCRGFPQVALGHQHASGVVEICVKVGIKMAPIMTTTMMMMTTTTMIEMMMMMMMMMEMSCSGLPLPMERVRSQPRFPAGLN